MLHDCAPGGAASESWTSIVAVAQQAVQGGPDPFGSGFDVAVPDVRVPEGHGGGTVPSSRATTGTGTPLRIACPRAGPVPRARGCACPRRCTRPVRPPVVRPRHP